MSEPELEHEEEVTVEPEVEPKSEPTQPSLDKTGLRDTIRAAVLKSQEPDKEPEEFKSEPRKVPEKGPDGKFAKAPEKVEQPLEGAPPDAIPKKDAAPGTWKPDAKAKWETLDPLVKTEVLRRESESTREVAKYQKQIEQINQSYTPIEKIIGPRRALWRTQFGSEEQALNQLMNISDLASQDPTAFLKFYVSQPDISSRLDLTKVFGDEVDTSNNLSSNPVVQQLQNTVQGLNQQVSSFINQRNDTELKTVEQQIDEYISAQDGNGTLLRPHFETVRQDIFNMLPAIRTQYPNDSVVQVMEKAYNTAIHTNPDLAGEMKRLQTEGIRANLDKEERAKKAVLANKSLDPGTPGNGQAGAVQATDLRSEIANNVRKFARGEQQRV